MRIGKLAITSIAVGLTACGGGGGGGGSTTGGNPPLPTDCTMLALADADIAAVSQVFVTVSAPTAENYGGPDTDYFFVDIYDFSSGTYALGTGNDANYATCDRCVTLARDANDQGTDPDQKLFFANQGNITVTFGDAGNDLSYLAFENVQLVEIALDDTSHSTEVENGECYALPNVDWQF